MSSQTHKRVNPTPAESGGTGGRGAGVTLLCPQVVLGEEQTVEEGERLAHQLMEELGVGEEDLISGAYLDLLLAKGESGS